MTDLSKITNEKLRDLLKASKKFNKLSEEDQKKHLKKMEGLDAEKEKNVIDFLTKENEKEKAEEVEKLNALKKIYDKVLELEKNFTKLMKADPEEKNKNEDVKKMSNLLNQLNNI